MRYSKKEIDFARLFIHTRLYTYSEAMQKLKVKTKSGVAQRVIACMRQEGDKHKLYE